MKRLFFVAGISFLTASLFSEYVINNHKTSIILCIILAVIVPFAILFSVKFSKKIIFKYIAVICAFASLSQGLWSVKQENYRKITDEYDGKEIYLTLQMVEEPELSRNGYWMCTAKAVGDEVPFSGKIYFVDYTNNLGIFDYISGYFELNKSEEKFEKRNKGDNILFFAKLNAKETYDIYKTNETTALKFFYSIKSYIVDTLDDSIGHNSVFARGLITGDDSVLPENDYVALQNSGLAHITSVSGLHVSILSAIVLRFLFFLKNKVARNFLCLGTLIILCGICGFAPSALRAAFMIGVTFVGEMIGRKGDSRNAFGIAVLCLLIPSPFLICSVSFLLSFFATLGIILLNPILSKLSFTFLFTSFSYIPSRFMRGIISSITISISCLIFVSPITYLFFGTVTPASIIANLLTISVVNIVFFLCIVILALGLIPFGSFIAAPFAFITNLGVNYIMFVANRISALTISGLSFNFGNINILWYIVIALVLGASIAVLVLTKKHIKKKKLKTASKIICIVSISLFVLTFSLRFFITDNHKDIPDNVLVVTFLNVGQGNCAIIQYGDELAVVDCGGSLPAGQLAADYLRKNKIDDIDYLFISHLHDDHSNGVSILCDKYSVDKIIMPSTEGEAEMLSEVLGAAEKNDIPIIYADDDFTINFGDTIIEVMTEHLDPDAEDQNENSVTLLLEYLDFSALFTGDITANAERRIIESYGPFSIDVISVPHHGSKYSSSEEFIAFTSPIISVASVSAGNTYGHPDGSVIARLERYGDVFTTKEHGNVVIKTDGVYINVDTGQ